MRHRRGLIALSVAGALLVSTKPVAAQQTLNLSLGYFTVLGEDARVERDVLNENRNFLAFEISDFDGATVGAEWLVPLGGYLEAGAGVGFSRRTVSSVYEQFVDIDGSEIEQDLRLRLVPVALTLRVAPFGLTSSVQPYFGGGLGILNWRYSESGEFVDFQNIGLDGQYATWAGTILSRQQPIVIIAEEGREQESALRLGRIGFDNVIGYLQDGLRCLEARPELITSIERLSPAVAAQLLVSKELPQIVDVRTPSEHKAKRIEGSLCAPLNHLAARVQDLPADRPLLVHCAGGYRSSIAVSLLRQRGFSRVGELVGGIAAWEAAGFPLNLVSA